MIISYGPDRYSVDDRWLVPHFEKMLYDNGLLARAYVDAYRVTGLEDLRAVAEQTLEYLTNDMQAPGGGFYAARDADSEGEEGIFYVWTLQELESALGSDEARLFARVYDVSDGGNFEGRNILHLPHELSSISRAEGITQAQLEETLERQRRILLDKRARREPPFRDEKILVSWNSMAIRAFAEAGPTLNRWGFVDTASKAALWIWAELRPGGQLLRVLTDGIAKIPAFLEDYAALGN
ncbi:MAG TPA: thioredoxin domain-containing protein, partial [Gemmatimonadetes bacterium]|nr:thioredoxin domain-containing protein [Gemmatimonadota bacterium]